VLEVVDKALTLNPYHTNAWNLRGVSYSWLQRYDEALASYDKALTIDPNYQEALDNKNKLVELYYSKFGPWIRSSWGGASSSADGKFDNPNDIAVSRSGLFYVVDYSNHRIQKFDGDGRFIRTWGKAKGKGNLYFPTGIALQSLGNDYFYVYVGDTSHNCIQKFDGDGRFIRTWGTRGSGYGQFKNPKGVAVDSLGNVYVADDKNNRIQKFDGDGRFIRTWGTEGSGYGQFKNPKGVAVDSLGNVYVADDKNNRIQKFVVP
jgi:tripartite motif-containing protein 71